jgi:hypothetical protein
MLLPLQVDFLMDEVEKRLLSVEQKHVLFRCCFLLKFLEMPYVLEKVS